MATHTAIITGGNLGLGFKTAKWIAQQKNWTVVLACRSLERGKEAAKRIIEETENNQVYVLELDLASMKSIRSFVDEFFNNKDLPVLRVLICNAGLLVINPSQTEDGFETTFGVNHLGHFLLANLILKKRVEDKTPMRIIFVSSGTHDPKQKTGMPSPKYTNAKDLAYPEPVPEDNQLKIGRRRYTTSKLCNVLCTYEFGRQLAKLGINHVTVNAFDPGLMPGSGLARDYNKFMKFMWNKVLPIMTVFGKNTNSTATSGKNLCSLAIEDKYNEVTSKYFEGKKEILSSNESYDEEKARELWTNSMELCKLTADDSIF